MKHFRFFLIAVLAALPLLILPIASAQSGNVWQVTLYPNLSWAPPPAFSYSTTNSYFNWGTNPPAPGMPNENWSAVMTSTAAFNPGTYRIQILTSGEYIFRVNTLTYQNTIGTGQAGKTQIFDVPMNGGNNFLELDFKQYTGSAYVTITWAPVGPGPTPQPAPSTCAPVAPSASSVVTPFGDYTRCIQQNLHQSECFVANGEWNAPNLGSIQMEPKIVVWGQCTPDQGGSMIIQACGKPQSVKCSKTGAGWFPG
jgi:hypothetical protein